MRESHKRLSLYRPTQSEGLPLNLNTCRLTPHPAMKHLPAILEEMNLSNYPDNECKLLRKALAKQYGLKPESFLVGNGSDEVFDLVFKTFLEPGEIAAYPGPSYVMYSHYALANGAEALEVPLADEFNLDPDVLLNTNAKLLVICNPNNPTGNIQNSADVERVIRSGRLVVIDEAYAEFCGGNWISRVKEFPNLLVVRTFSKVYGMAGLRVGYVAANPELIENIDRVRLPFNVNSISQALAVAVLKEQGFVKDHITMINKERAHWTEMLSKNGFQVWPSDTNFLLVEVPNGIDRNQFAERLEKAGALVQCSKTHPRLSSCLRISIGTMQDRAEFQKVLDIALSA